MVSSKHKPIGQMGGPLKSKKRTINQITGGPTLKTANSPSCLKRPYTGGDNSVKFSKRLVGGNGSAGVTSSGKAPFAELDQNNPTSLLQSPSLMSKPKARLVDQEK